MTYIPQEARTAVGITDLALLTIAIAMIVWWMYTHRFRMRVRYLRLQMDLHEGRLCGLSFVCATNGTYHHENQQGMRAGEAAMYCADKKYATDLLPEATVDKNSRLNRWIRTPAY